MNVRTNNNNNNLTHALTFCFIGIAFLNIFSIGSISGYAYTIQMLHTDSSIHVMDDFPSFSMASRTVES